MFLATCLLALCIASCSARGPPLISSRLAEDHNSIHDGFHPKLVGVMDDGAASTLEEDQGKTIYDREPDEGEVSWKLMEETARGVLPGPLWTALDGTLHTDEGAGGAGVIPPPPPLLQELGIGTLGMRAVPLAGYYLPDPELVSDPCKRDVLYFYQSISHKSWPYKMVDSWAKMPDGLMDGNSLAMGSMDECLSVDTEEEDNDFQGKYCIISFYKVQDTNASTNEKNFGMGEVNLRMASALGLLGPAMVFVWYSTCQPSTCSTADLWGSLMNVVNPQGINVSFVMCQTATPPTLAYNAADVIMIVVLTLLVLFVVASTVLDIFISYTNRQELGKGKLRYLLVFSLHTNLPKMFRINTNQNKEVITCLHGMRVLSMTWVVWGHQYIITIFVTFNKVPAVNKYMKGNWLNQIILNAMPSVDTFFFISGLLVAYGLSKEFERTKKFNPLIFYFHRFIRLSAPILLLAGFLAVFPPLLIRGPLAPLVTEPGGLVDLCSRFWWRDAFFVNNFFTKDDGNLETCLGVCWYTSVDFQLFIITPIIFLPLLYRRKPGAAWLMFVTLISFIIPAIIIGVNHLPPIQGIDTDQEKGVQYMEEIYIKPWCRGPPYLIGMWLGYFLWTSKKEVILKKWQVALGWTVAVFVGLAVIFGMHDYNEFSGKIHPYDPVVSILYGSLHRGAWGAALFWVVFACHNGFGGPVNDFLSHPTWQPISRLTYPIFLIAIPVQVLIYFHSVYVPLYFSHLNKMLETVGVLFISGMAAVGLSLLTEAPILGLERLLLKKS